MCTHVKTSEFVPALICEIAEKTRKETFRIPESVLWEVAEELENRCWSNVILSIPLLDDLVESMRRHETYGSSFIEYDLRTDGRPLILKGVDEKHRVAMSNYFFNSDTNWYKELDEILEDSIFIDDNGIVRFSKGEVLSPGKRKVHVIEPIEEK